MENKTLKTLNVKKAPTLDTSPAEHGLYLFTDLSKDATAKAKSKFKTNKVPKDGCSAAIGLHQTLGPTGGGGGGGGGDGGTSVCSLTENRRFGDQDSEYEHRGALAVYVKHFHANKTGFLLLCLFSILIIVAILFVVLASVRPRKLDQKITKDQAIHDPEKVTMNTMDRWEDRMRISTKDQKITKNQAIHDPEKVTMNTMDRWEDGMRISTKDQKITKDQAIHDPEKVTMNTMDRWEDGMRISTKDQKIRKDQAIHDPEKVTMNTMDRWEDGMRISTKSATTTEEAQKSYVPFDYNDELNKICRLRTGNCSYHERLERTNCTHLTCISVKLNISYDWKKNKLSLLRALKSIILAMPASDGQRCIYQTSFGRCLKDKCVIDLENIANNVTVAKQQIEMRNDSYETPKIVDTLKFDGRDDCLTFATSDLNTTGKLARDEIEIARQNIARMINCETNEIIFTSGGTEANNLVITSSIEYFTVLCSKNKKFCGRKPHFIVSAIEHDSVSLPLKHYSNQNRIELSIIPVDHSTGYVNVERLLDAIKINTCLISIMLANNETGVIQPIEGIGQKLLSINADRNLKVLLHSDAAQAIGKIPVDVKLLNVDYLTIVGHKFYGPRIGALFSRRYENDETKLKLYPNLFGGGQERTYRPGTENTPMIVGLGQAALLVNRNFSQYKSHMLEIRDYFEENLLKTVENVSINFRHSQRLPNTSSVILSATTISGADLLKKCQGFCASTGAACHDSTKASSILLACGVELENARRTVRFSFGRETSKEDVDIVINELCSIILNLNTDDNRFDGSLKRKSLENDQTDDNLKRSSTRVLRCDL